MKLPVFATTLGAELYALTAPGELAEALGDGSVRCFACAHHCVIADGSRGACAVRVNRGGELRVPFGYVARRYVRAVETNTIFHVAPGAQALTFGMYGCDLRCPYCQNHRVSQALRDGPTNEHPTPLTREELVDAALAAGCRVLCAAYNEPMLSVEWMRSVFELAQARGLVTAVVSDGHSTPEALRYLRPHADVFRVDLKAHDEASYKKLGGRLKPVLDTIELARKLGYWVEVVTLVVPGLNHDAAAVTSLGDWLREIDPAIPWHINGFVPRYRLGRHPLPDPVLLMMAAGSAYVRGSRFVYVGNVPACGALAHTRCAECHEIVIRRDDYHVVENRLESGGCPRCSAKLPGIAM